MNGLGAKTDKGKTGCVGWKYTYRETENESRAENLSLSSLSILGEERGTRKRRERDEKE
jgi:hypothetical protein